MSDTIMGHPKGLFVCFMTELWERFAYYGVFSLMILYLTKTYLLSDSEGNKIVAAYGALLFMLPVVGGIIADRWLGSRKAVSFGALLMAVGYMTMSFPGLLDWLFGSSAINSSDTPPINVLFFSMAIVVTGVGFLKANISTVVGALYSQDDPRRDSGFTIFYMGINIGVALGPIICGGIGQWVGLRYGFSTAGIGMLIGLATYLFGQKYLGDCAEPPNPEALRKQVLPGIRLEWVIYASGLLMVVVLWQALGVYEKLSGTLLWFSAALGLFILYFSFFRCESQERDRMLVIAVLITFTIVFFSLYLQLFGSMTLFADRLVDRHLFGIEIAASQLVGIPSIFVISLAPVFGFAWLKLAKFNHNPNIPVKFALSLILCGLAFMVPALGQIFSSSGLQISLFWLVMTFFVMVTGELCQIPIAMSMITKLCPKRVVGMMMGAFFVTVSIGSILSGELAARYTQIEKNADGSLVDAAAALETYVSAFWQFGFAAIGCGVVLYLISPLLYRRMHDHDETHGDSYILRFYTRIGLVEASAQPLVR